MATTPETITLQLKAKHFEGTRFVNTNNCAIAKAAKEQLNTERISVGSFSLSDFENKKCYSFEEYGYTEFEQDKEKALQTSFGFTVIREIVLTPIQ